MAYFRCMIGSGSGGETIYMREVNQQELVSQESELSGTATAKNELPLLYKNDDLIHNYYIDATTGAQVAYNGWSCTDFIDISNYEMIMVYSTASSNYNAFYDKNKTRVSGLLVPSDDYTCYVIDSNVKYVRLSFDDSTPITAHGIIALEEE